MNKETPKMFLVLGVRNTGSGSLTFPEDFTIVGVYVKYEDARADADARNEMNGFELDEEGGWDAEVGVNDEEFFDVFPTDVFDKRQTGE